MKKLILAVLIMVPLTGCDSRAVQFLACVINHESANEPNPVVAENPRSSASGLFQFLDSTWNVLSNRYGVHGYSRAKHAPAGAQILVAYNTVMDGGRFHWNGTGC